MKKIPSEVIVFGQTYKIKLVKNLKVDGNELHGDCCNKTKVIRLSMANSSQEMHQTLMHEVVHAFVYRLGLKQANLSDELEEIICEGISILFSEILVFRWK